MVLALGLALIGPCRAATPRWPDDRVMGRHGSTHDHRAAITSSLSADNKTQSNKSGIEDRCLVGSVAIQDMNLGAMSAALQFGSGPTP